MAKNIAKTISVKKQKPRSGIKAPSGSSRSVGLIVGACILVLAALGVGFGIYQYQKGFIKESNMYAIGDPKAPTVQVFEDPLCPFCAQYQQSPGAKALEKAAQENKIHVEYKLLNLLNPSSITQDYSSRADSVLLSIDKSTLSTPDKTQLLIQVHNHIFDPQFQPPEGKPSHSSQPQNHTNQEFADIVHRAADKLHIKLPAEVLQDIKTGKYIKETNQRAVNSYKIMRKNHIQGTPSILFNGKVYGVFNDDPRVSRDKNGPDAAHNPQNISSPAFVEMILKSASPSPDHQAPQTHHK